MVFFTGKYNLGTANKVTSVFNSATVNTRDYLLSEGNGVILNEINDWEQAWNKKFDNYVIDSLEVSHLTESFSHQGLVSEFSAIKSVEDIAIFADKYGLLGLSHPLTKKTSPTEDGVYADLTEFYEGHEVSRYGLSCLRVEPLEFWMSNINKIRKLMRVYRLLKKHNADNTVDLEGELIDFLPIATDTFRVIWADGEETPFLLSQAEIESLGTVGILRKVLVDSITFLINNDIQVVPTVTDSPLMPLGFCISEGLVTKNLLSAIYYDFWHMLNKNVTISICKNDACRLPFQKTKRQIYCSNSCKQQAYRIRKEVAKQIE